MTLNHALERLPADLRECLVLRELEELSYKEIAHVIDVPVGTVMSRLWRARQALTPVPGGRSTPMKEDDCQEMRLLVQADHDGELSPAEAARVAAHLEPAPIARSMHQRCPRCPPASAPRRPATRPGLASRGGAGAHRRRACPRRPGRAATAGEVAAPAAWASGPARRSAPASRLRPAWPWR